MWCGTWRSSVCLCKVKWSLFPLLNELPVRENSALECVVFTNEVHMTEICGDGIILLQTAYCYRPRYRRVKFTRILISLCVWPWMSQTLSAERCFFWWIQCFVMICKKLYMNYNLVAVLLTSDTVWREKKQRGNYSDPISLTLTEELFSFLSWIDIKPAV